MPSAVVVLTFAAALGSGLTAGVLFGFSTFVVPALERLPAAQGIAGGRLSGRGWTRTSDRRIISHAALTS